MLTVFGIYVFQTCNIMKQWFVFAMEKVDVVGDSYSKGLFSYLMIGRGCGVVNLSQYHRERGGINIEFTLNIDNLRW